MKRPQGFRGYTPPIPVAEPVEAPPVAEPALPVAEPAFPVAEPALPVAEHVEARTSDEQPTDVIHTEVLDDLPRGSSEVELRERGPRAWLVSRGGSRTSSALAEAKRDLRLAKRRRRNRERAERRRFTQFSRERRGKLLMGIGAVAALGLFVGVGLFTPLMSVRTIEVEGTHRISAPEITSALAQVTGTPLALIDEAVVFASLEGFSLIESFAVEAIPPSTLRVVITERSPVVAVTVGEQLQLLDAAGVEIELVAPDALPATIPVMQEAMPVSSTRFTAVTTMLRSLPDELLARIVEVSAETPQQIELVLEGGLPVVWGDAKNNLKKAVVLESMLTSLGDRRVSSIDVSSYLSPVFVP